MLLNQLTPEDLKSQLLSIYNQADQDKNGIIDEEEMLMLLSSVEGLPTFDMEKVRELMATINGGDEDATTVSFEAFVPVAWTVLKRLFLNKVAQSNSNNNNGSSDEEEASGDGTDDADIEQDIDDGLDRAEDGSVMAKSQDFLQTVAPEDLERMLKAVSSCLELDTGG